MYTKKRLALSEPFVSYFFLPDPNVGCQPAAASFWLGAAAIVLIFSFFGFLDSRFASLLALCQAVLLGFGRLSRRFRCDGKITASSRTQ
jgi:hypothetical protein